MADEENSVEQDIIDAIEASINKGPIEEAVEEPQEEVIEEITEEVVEEVAVEPAYEIQVISAPDNWDADRKSVFDGLSDEASKQTYLDTVKSLERGYQSKFDELATTRKEHEQIVGLMQPFETQLNASGLDRVAGIRQLVGAQQLLMDNPAQGLSQLVQQFGGQNAQAIVSQLAQQYGVAPAAESEAYVDPEIKSLQDQVSQQNTYLQQIETNAQTQRVSEAQNQIDLFKNATDDKGGALHPHFERVEKVMGTLISNGIAEDMNDAYNRAIYSDPELRNEFIEQEKTSVAERLNTDRREKVADSKRASKNVKTNHVAPESAPPEPDDIRESVRNAYRASAV